MTAFLSVQSGLGYEGKYRSGKGAFSVGCTDTGYSTLGQQQSSIVLEVVLDSHQYSNMRLPDRSLQMHSRSSFAAYDSSIRLVYLDLMTKLGSALACP